MSKKYQIKSGWMDAGKQCTVLGDKINVNGRDWTPVLFDDEEDPDWHKSDSLEEVVEPERIEVTSILAQEPENGEYVYRITCNHSFPPNSENSVKAAIEGVLNPVKEDENYVKITFSVLDSWESSVSVLRDVLEKFGVKIDYPKPSTTPAPEQFVMGVDPIRGNFEWKDDAQTQVVFKREEKGEWVAMYRKDKPWSQEQFEADMKKAAEYFSKVPLLCEKCGEIGKHKETCSQYTPPKPQPLFNWVVFTKEGFGFDTWVKKDWRGDLGSNWDDSVKVFIVGAEADEFIIMNRPCLSVEDIIYIYKNTSNPSDFQEYIIKLAKSKQSKQ